MRGALARRGAPFGLLASTTLVVGCLFMLLLLVAASTVLPFPAIGAAVFLVVFVTLGFERCGTFLMVLSVFFAPMNNVRAVAGSASITASDVLFLVAMGLLLPTMLRKPLRLPAPYVAGASGLVAFGIVASVVSGTPLLSLLLMSRLVIAGIVLPVVFMWWRPNLRLLVIMATGYVCGEIVSVFYSLIDPVQVQRAYGLTTHVNNFGLASLLALCLLPFIWSQLSRALRPLTWIAGLICAWGVWTSGSRAALLMAGVVALLYPLLERSGKVAWLGAFAGTCGLLFLSRIRNADQKSALGRLFGGDASVNSDRERSDALKLGWKQFNERPITGRGFVDVIDFHNIYLGVAVAVGVIGLAFMLTLLWSAVQPLFFAPRPYGLMAYAGLAYAGFGALSTNLWDRFVWIVLSMILAARMLAEDATDAGEGLDVPKAAAPPLQLSARSV
jgi:hypothetical protein